MTIVAALRRLHTDLHASVDAVPGENSRLFQVQHGVRQGDPLSPLLFSLVLQQALTEVEAVWRRRGYGAQSGMSIAGERLTHVPFADDMTLVATSWLSTKRMLSTLRQALARQGPVEMQTPNEQPSGASGRCRSRGMVHCRSDEPRRESGLTRYRAQSR